MDFRRCKRPQGIAPDDLNPLAYKFSWINLGPR